MPSSSAAPTTAARSSRPIYPPPDCEDMPVTTSRREFLGASAGLALAGATSAADPVRRVGGDLLSRMTWMNAPADVHYAEGVLNVRSRGKTDFWRKTFY